MFKKLRIFIPFLCLFLLIGVSDRVSAAGTTSVSTYEAFKQALNDSTVSVINVTANLSYLGGQDEPLVIPNSVTINGEGYYLNTGDAGIVLGADVVINGLDIQLSNFARNCIILNGHSLTLNNVDAAGGTPNVDIFCGELKDYTGQNVTAGSHSILTVTGSTTGIHSIYAGSFSDSKGSNPTGYANPVTVNINSNNSGIINAFYGHGGNEPSAAGNGNAIEGSADTYPVAGTVTINITSTAQPITDKIYAKTGSSTAAKVVYNGHADYSKTFTFDNAGEIVVQSGHLNIGSGSTFLDDSQSLSVNSGAYLYLNSLGNSLIFQNFTGGGSLILGTQQGLMFMGTVTGKTDVSLNFPNFPDNPVENVAYITAGTATSADAFTFNVGASYTGVLPTFQNGVLKIHDTSSGGDSTVVLVDDFTLTNATAASGDVTASLPLSVIFNTASVSSDAENIPFAVSVNGTKCTVDSSSGWFTYSTSEYELFVNVDQLVIQTVGDGTFTDTTLTIELTVPQTNSGTGASITKAATLTIGSGGVTPPPAADITVAVPTAVSDLVYTGQVQTGVNSITGVTLTGHTGTNATSYMATAVPNTGYAWEDGTKTPKQIPWEIAPKPLTVSSLVLKEKEYDGTTAVQVQSITFSDGSQSNITIDCSTDASYTTNSVGTGKTANVTVTLNNTNYVLPQPTTVATGNIIKRTVSMTQAPAGLAFTLGTAKEYEYSLSQLTAGYQVSLGTLTYTVKSVSLGSYYNESVKKAYVDGALLKVPIQNTVPASYADTGTIVIAVSGENVNTFERTITCTINAPGTPPAKVTPTGSPTYTTVTSSGKTLANVSLAKGTIKVDGSVVWELPTTTVITKNTSYRWIFIPTDESKYERLTGSVVLYKENSTGSGATSSGGSGSGVSSSSSPSSSSPSSGSSSSGGSSSTPNTGTTTSPNSATTGNRTTGSATVTTPNAGTTARPNSATTGNGRIGSATVTTPQGVTIVSSGTNRRNTSGSETRSTQTEREENIEESQRNNTIPEIEWTIADKEKMSSIEQQIFDQNGNEFILVNEALSEQKIEEIWTYLEGNSETRQVLGEMTDYQLMEIYLKSKQTGEEVEPSSKIEFLLFYPQGTDETFEFVVVHLEGGTKPVILKEGIDYTKQEKGFVVTLDNFSPFVVGWKSIEEVPSQDDAVQTVQTSAEPVQKEKEGGILWLTIGIIVVVAIGSGGYYMYIRNKTEDDHK